MRILTWLTVLTFLLAGSLTISVASGYEGMGAMSGGCPEGYSISSVYWSASVDKDHDGYVRTADLVFDANVGSGTHAVYASLFYKVSGTSGYQLYAVTPEFSIHGCDIDMQNMHVGFPGQEPQFNGFDFKIELYESGTGAKVAEVSASGNPSLSAVKLESVVQDGPRFTVAKHWWDEPTDLDGDGFAVKRRLHVDVDVAEGSHKVYLVYVARNGGMDYRMYISGAFDVTGSTSDDAASFII